MAQIEALATTTIGCALRLHRQLGPGLLESAYEVVLRNAKSEAVTVTVREPVPGDWTMLEESQPHAKVASGTAEWQVRIPANGSTSLKYRVLVRY